MKTDRLVDAATLPNGTTRKQTFKSCLEMHTRKQAQHFLAWVKPSVSVAAGTRRYASGFFIGVYIDLTLFLS